MTRLSAPQIAGYAKGAGFTGADIAIAVAVALAESGGRTDAINKSNSDGSRDYGLWQINSVHASLLASGTWSDPADNARMAHKVFSGSGWRAWTTYNSGAYLRSLSIARNAADNPAATTGGSSSFQADAKGWSGKPPYAVTKVGVTRFTFKADKVYTVNVNKTSGTSDEIYGTVSPKFNMDKFMPLKEWTQTNGAMITNQHAGGGGGLEAWLGNYVVLADRYNSGKTRQGTNPKDPLDKTIDAASSIGDLISFLTKSENWIRIGLFVVGVILLLIAAYQVSSGSIPLGPVGSVVKAVV